MANKSEDRDIFDFEDEEAGDEELLAREIRRREEDDFKWLMGHAQGRRLAWRILAATGVFRTSFTGNSETFFREGMRNIGLMVLSEINDVTPERYTQMLKENRTDEQ